MSYGALWLVVSGCPLNKLTVVHRLRIKYKIYFIKLSATQIYSKIVNGIAMAELRFDLSRVSFWFVALISQTFKFKLHLLNLLWICCTTKPQQITTSGV